VQIAGDCFAFRAVRDSTSAFVMRDPSGGSDGYEWFATAAVVTARYSFGARATVRRSRYRIGEELVARGRCCSRGIAKA
jgi:hypothetical protein